MTAEYAFFLALIQGLTEFLPISSSAHLILPSALFGFADQGLAFDVAVHIGSLGAVCLSLRVECERIARGMLIGAGSRYPRHAKLGWMLAVATVPAVVIGLLAKGWIEGYLRADWVIATTTLVFGLLLWWAHYQKGRKGFSSIGFQQALLLGFAQALALIPGTSRSGITLTAGLWLGLSRRIAAKFSFLMSIPIIVGAGLVKTKDLLESTEPVAWDAVLLGVAVSFVAAYACIRLFLAWITRVGLLPFVWYRLALAAVLFAVIFWP
jgi:undecaprenyl-diphosphatase